MTVCVLGAGAFGTALAMSFARAPADVTLVARDEDCALRLQTSRENAARLPGVTLPERLSVSHQVPDSADIVLLAVPMQQLSNVVRTHQAALLGKLLVACCKGLSLETGAGPTMALSTATPHPAILTGPSFAADIARGLPTALTLACADRSTGIRLQRALVAPNLRLYRTDDVTGAEIGGALKNVIAIGCGAVMGAGLGVSARAALMTRGFAEMQRFAQTAGADAETLSGLSGLGDLTLTCTSDLSRNYRYGKALGAGESFESGVTVEGAATARALAKRAAQEKIDMPLTHAITDLIDGRANVHQAMTDLLARPIKEE
ncbi:NAD(P)H-dependent glycerol-3-phosphate dehydrogenase [Roseobacteraceae bacterium S113]